MGLMTPMTEELSEDIQPTLLSDRQFSELEMYKERALSDCFICNGSGYNVGGRMCDCLAGVMFRYRLLCSNIPKEYQDVDFGKFKMKTDPGFIQVRKYTKKLDNARNKGIGLHLYTEKPGSGKTLLATCILLEAIRRGYYVWFTSLEQLIEDLKLGYKDEIIRKKMQWVMFHTDFLLLDEVAKFQSTEWRDSKINDLIQRRVNEKLPIISTDNVSLHQMLKKHPEHLISRFVATQLEVQLLHSIEYRRDVLKKNLTKELFEE
jgi:DNA replication protein DnaC